MAELAYAYASGAYGVTLEGSTPSFRTFCFKLFFIPENNHMNPAQVSIIMSVYNGQRYIEESIDSVLNQQFGDFEFLIYDDGSTDNTAAIVGSKKDARIKFLRSEVNQGLFPALNKLITQAKGKYIRLWSHDDIMKPHCLATEIEFYEHNPQLGFCYTTHDSIDEQSKLLPPPEMDETPAIVSPLLATQLLFYWGCLPGNISTVMIKKETLLETGGFDSNFYQTADFDLWVRISEKYSIGCIREPLVLIRRHSGQFSRWKKMIPVIMREHRQIYERLLKRMPPELISYARQYHCRYVYVQYFQCLLNHFFRGDLGTAREILTQLRKYDHIFVIFWFWLCALGGRRRLNPYPKIKESADL